MQTYYRNRGIRVDIKSSTTTYELSMDELKELLAKELKVDVGKISLSLMTREGGDDRFGRTPYRVDSGIKVVINNK